MRPIEKHYNYRPPNIANQRATTKNTKQTRKNIWIPAKNQRPSPNKTRFCQKPCGEVKYFVRRNSQVGISARISPIMVIVIPPDLPIYLRTQSLLFVKL